VAQVIEFRAGSKRVYFGPSGAALGWRLTSSSPGAWHSVDFSTGCLVGRPQGRPLLTCGRRIGVPVRVRPTVATGIQPAHAGPIESGVSSRGCTDRLAASHSRIGRQARASLAVR
jgi:hypothetical protein